MSTTSTSSKYDITAEEVLRGVGGVENVISVTHCATRLRFALKDRDKADKSAVEATRGVITVVEAGGQFQVVIGNTVPKVYESIAARGASTGEGGSSGGFLARAIDLITSIFTPFLWVLAATGLLKALLAVAVQFSEGFGATPTYAILFATSDAIFQFLPVLLAVTAAKRFKANQFTAIAIASALIYSATLPVIALADAGEVSLLAFSESGEQLTFLGVPVIMVSYLSAVIPTILAVYFQSHVERLFDRIIPEALRNFATPMLTLLIVVPLTFLAIGPATTWLGDGISSGINWLWGLTPIIGGLLMGALWQVFVIFGVHWGFVPLITQDLVTQGYSIITGPLFAAVLAQSGATAAVFLKTRNRELKEVSGTATVSAFLAGVTEPAIYGVTLRLKRPFVFACIGGAIGGAIAAAGGSAAEGFVLPGAITLTATLGIGNFTLQLIGTGLAILIAFVLTFVFGFKDLPADGAPAASGDVEAAASATPGDGAPLAVLAPAGGRVVPLAEVPDKVFSSGAIGSGAAVLPEDGRITAPISGELITAMPHAFGIRSDDGVEILVHVGIDTVKLDGEHFEAAVSQGQRVAAGDLLTTVDLTAVRAAGYDPITVVLVTTPGIPVTVEESPQALTTAPLFTAGA